MRGKVLGLCATVLFATAAYATAQHEDHTAHDHTAMAEPSPRDNAPTRAYKAAMTKMHGNMDIRYTGDADRDFVNGMIPHHQGAVEMAEIVLKYGKDPAVKRLARSIIIAQKKEIRYMEKLRSQSQSSHAH